jgi:hypothetical protein
VAIIMVTAPQPPTERHCRKDAEGWMVTSGSPGPARQRVTSERSSAHSVWKLPSVSVRR